MSSSGARPAKRQRTRGVPTKDSDTVPDTSQDRYKNAVSTRSIGPLPSLVTCCIRAFARHIKKLSADQRSWDAVLRWLKLIPEQLLPKIFAMLKATHPTLLNNEFIVCVSARAWCKKYAGDCLCPIQNFMRGRSLSLTSDLPGVSPQTFRSISRVVPSLVELRLDAFSKIPDKTFSTTVASLSSLELLDVSCVEVVTMI